MMDWGNWTDLPLDVGTKSTKVRDKGPKPLQFAQAVSVRGLAPNKRLDAGKYLLRCQSFGVTRIVVRHYGSTEDECDL